MSHLSIAQSDTIRAAFRVARDAIVACDPLTIAQHHETLSVVIYTAVRALRLPAVRGRGRRSVAMRWATSSRTSRR